MLKIVNYNNDLEVSLKSEIMNHIIKSLSKQEGLNFCWDARFLNLFFNLNQLPATKNQLPNKRLVLFILSGL